MSVSNGEKANATNFNDAFVSRKVDTNTVGKLDLNNTATESGTQILNVQKEHNSRASFLGQAVNQAKDNKPTWNSDTIGAPNDDVKTRVDNVQTQVEANTLNKTDKVSPSVDNTLVRFDGITGDQQGSGVTLDDSDNMIVPGNLTVQGDTTIIGETITTDPLIEVNDTGNQAAADAAGAGIKVRMTDATDAGLRYDSTLASKFKLGEEGSEKEIITSTEIQSLSGKTVTFSDLDLSGPAGTSNRVVVSSNTNANLTALARKKGAIYFDDTNNQYVGDDGSTLIDLGGGGTGQGGINYILNPDSEGGTGDTATSANVSIGVDTTTPLRGDSTFNVTYTGAAIGNYAEWDMSIVDRQDLKKRLYVSFNYSTDSSLAVGELEVVLRDTTAATDLIVDNGEDGELLPTGDFANRDTFTGAVEIDDTNRNYTLRIQAKVGSLTRTIRVDNIIVGPDTLVPGSIVTKPISFTPSFNNFTLGNGTIDHSIYWREGKFMIGKVRIALGSTSVMGASPSIDIPAGESIDTNEVNADADTYFGEGVILDTGSARYTLKMLGATSTSISLATLDSSATPSVVFVSSTVPMTWTTNDSFEFTFKVPIEGWSAGAVQSTTETIFSTMKILADISTASHTNNNNWQDISFTETKDELGAFDGTTFTAPFSGEFDFQSSISFDANATGTRGISVLIDGSTRKTGNVIDNAGAGSITSVVFSQTLTLNKSQTVKFQGFQNSGGNLGYTASLSNMQITGRPDFSIFSVTGENEFQAGTSSTKTPLGTNHWQQMVGNDLDLTPGQYLLYGMFYCTQSGAAGWTTQTGGWYSANGADNTTEPALLDAPASVTIDAGLASDGGVDLQGSLVAPSRVSMHFVRITVTANVTIYLVPRSFLSTPANGRVATYAYAERIA